MGTLNTLVAGLSQLSSSFSTNQVSEISKKISKLYVSSPMAVLETHTALGPIFTEHYTGPKPAFSSEANAPVRRDDFVSDLPASFSPSREHEFMDATTPSLPGWSAEQICGVVAVLLIVPFILVSNLLVIVSVVRFKRLQMPTNYFIVSLAAVDIFVAVVTPFFIVIEVLPGQVENPVLCLSPNRILMTACGVSVLTLAAIAYDRHTALVSPLKYVSVMTIRKIAVVVTFIWFYSAAIVWAPIPLGWFSGMSRQNVSPPKAIQPCSFQLLHDSAHVLFLSAIFGPACVAITVCYFRIYTVARHHARAIAAVENAVHHNLRVRFMMKDAKYAKTLALVIGVFLVLWTPYLACLMAEVITNVHITPWLWNYLTLLAVLNSGLNPWIYAFKNNDFRTAFRKILRACCNACCHLCGRRFCPHFVKDSRRPSALSDVNVFTTMTSASQSRPSRMSQGSMSPSGRLSDVSCIVSVGVESVGNVGKVFNVNHRDSIVSVIHPSVSAKSHRNSLVSVIHPSRVSTKTHRDSLVSAIYPAVSAKSRRNSIVSVIHRSVSATFDNDATIHSTAESTEKRVSTLLNVDSKAFIADLLSLYLHHSLVHRPTDVESQSDLEDREFSDVSEHSDHIDSDHADHSYTCDHTNHCYDSEHAIHIYHIDHANLCCHSDQMECSCHSEHVERSCHCDDKDHSCDSDCTDHSCHSDHTDHSYHGDKTYQNCHSDNTDLHYHRNYSDHSCYCRGADPNYSCDPTDPNHKSDQRNPGYRSFTDSKHRREPSCHSDHTEQGYYSDLTDHSYHGDHTDRGYHSDHTDHSCQSDNPEHADLCHLHAGDKNKSQSDNNLSDANGDSVIQCCITATDSSFQCCHNDCCGHIHPDRSDQDSDDSDRSEGLDHINPKDVDSDGAERCEHICGSNSFNPNNADTVHST